MAHRPDPSRPSQGGYPARRRPVTVFLLLALGLGWAALTVPLLAGLPMEPFLLVMTYVALLGSALLVTAWPTGRPAARRRSALSGAPFPREYGQFSTRDQDIAYLQRYATDRNLTTVETGVEVSQIRPNNGGWCVNTSADKRHAEPVVVATDALNQPKLPAWATEEALDGEVLHSSAYRNPTPFVGRTVVVAAAGTSGMEIAYQLAAGGARQLLQAVRTPPNIFLRELNGLPGDLPVPLLLHLPDALVDRLQFALQRKTVGDLSAYGLPRPTGGAMASIRNRGGDRVRPRGGRARRRQRGPGRRAPRARRRRHRRHGVPDRPGGPCQRPRGAEPPRPAPGRNRPRGDPGLRFVGCVFRPGLTEYVGKIAKRLGREITAMRTD